MKIARMLGIAAVAGVMTLAAGSALAQPAKTLTLPKPPVAKVPDDPPVLMSYLFVVVIMGGAVGAALIPSKRGHQD